MPDTIYTRINGYHPTGSEVNLGDRIFNGSQQINAAGHAGIGSLPWAGPAYTAGRAVNALAHWIGRMNNKNASTPTTSLAGTQRIGGAAPTDAGAFEGDPTDPNNPNNYQLGPGTTTTASSSAQGGMSARDYFNSMRSAGSQTYQQGMNPGSAIGPFGGGSNRPYSMTRGARGLGTPNSAGLGITPEAAAAMANVRSRNQL